MSLADLARAAGVIGAGGAGFPTHVKVAAEAEVVVANGAECEPLMYKDTELMTRCPERVIAGLKASMQAVGAQRGVLGIKGKRHDAIDALKPHLDGVELLELGDFYPSGDEYELVYAATGKLIPAGGIPLQVGCVVHNVESLAWLADAAEGRPVTEKWLTVTGAVAEPKTFVTPLGLSLQELIDFCGGVTVDDPVGLIGGAMMGRICTDFSAPVTRTTGGLIVLDRDHPLMRRKLLPAESMMRIGKSACDQCSYCTELCPRYLLGYDVQPHKVMRSLEFVATGTEIWNRWAQLCCSCGICTLYSCPEGLFPKEACDQAKADLRELGVKWLGRGGELKAHPMHEDRRVPVKKLVGRLGLTEYDRPAPYAPHGPDATRFVYPLGAHVGAPAVPVVKVGDQLTCGQVIAEIPEGQLGARVHAAADASVVEIGEQIVTERR